MSRPDARILKIRLEDLLTDARATMSKVLDHVGEPWDDAVLDHARHLPDKNDMPPFPWLESAARPRGAPAAEWRDMTPLQIRLVEHVSRKIMKEFGYERADLPPAAEPSRAAVFWAQLRELPETFRYMATYWRLARFLRDAKNFDADETQALFKRVNPPSWSRYPGFEMPIAPRFITA
jgi:hypothetical protein